MKLSTEPGRLGYEWIAAMSLETITLSTPTVALSTETLSLSTAPVSIQLSSAAVINPLLPAADPPKK